MCSLVKGKVLEKIKCLRAYVPTCLRAYIRMCVPQWGEEFFLIRPLSYRRPCVKKEKKDDVMLLPIHKHRERPLAAFFIG